MRRHLLLIAIFACGALLGAVFSSVVVFARTTPSTAFKTTPEVLGLLVTQNGETQDILDKLVRLEEKQEDWLEKMHYILKNQLDEQKRIRDEVRELKDIVKRK